MAYGAADESTCEAAARVSRRDSEGDAPEGVERRAVYSIYDVVRQLESEGLQKMRPPRFYDGHQLKLRRAAVASQQPRLEDDRHAAHVRVLLLEAAGRHVQ